MSRPAFSADKSLTLQGQFDAAVAFIGKQAGDLEAADALLGEQGNKLTALEARVSELTAANADLNGKLTAAEAAKVSAVAERDAAVRDAASFDARVEAKAREIFASMGGPALPLAADGKGSTSDEQAAIAASLEKETDPAKRYVLAKKLGDLRAKASK